MGPLGNGILTQLQAFAKPIFTAAVIFLGLYFLVKKEFIRIMELGGVAIIAGVLIFNPAVIQTIATDVAHSF